MDSAIAVGIGEKILNPVMTVFGLAVEGKGSGKGGSGGPSSWIKYSGNGRSLECHYRYGSLLALYVFRGEEISHSDLVWAITGSNNSVFPTYSEEANIQFQALADDILNITSLLFTISIDEVDSIIYKVKNRPKGFGALGK